ncbi:MAG: metal-sensitive transcriptional regulator [Candidatus Omnitrophica bacterium]|nr:metal-sensitive transcriptional regulator [Candidatus Omnitrophota bacterium]
MPTNELKKKTIGRLNRISGQINGIKQMIENDRDCADIILQVAAIRAAVTQLGVVMVESHMEECVRQTIKSGNSKALAHALNKVMKRMLK